MLSWIRDSAQLADHQRSAVAIIIERLRRYGGALLADAPGLGKSYVAADVARLYVALGSQVEVVVPATLTWQWRETLRRFGVDALVTTHDALARLPYMPDARPRLLIVDEAHAFRNASTQRYAALARRAIGAVVLLVTATPVCNRIGDLHNILSIAVPDHAFAGCGVPSLDRAFDFADVDAIRLVLGEIAIRRDASVLPDSLMFGALERHLVRFEVFTGGGRVTELLSRLAFPLLAEPELLRRFLWRRLESSEAAFAETLGRQVRFYGRALESIRSGRTLTRADYRRLFREEDAEAMQQVLFWELFAGVRSQDEPALIEEEIRLSGDLQAAVSQSPRAKERQLRELLVARRVPALVFTGSIATAESIARALPRDLRPALVTGRSAAHRDQALAMFERGLADVLVCTDVAAEGLNLQRAGIVVHYDLPWNPVKLDQRNGRAHRIGQKRDAVESFYFVPAGDSSGVARILGRKSRMRNRVLQRAAAAEPVAGTLRPHLARGASEIKLARALDAAGMGIPRHLFAPQRAGMRRLIEEMSGEFLDGARLDYLQHLLDAEAAVHGGCGGMLL